MIKPKDTRYCEDLVPIADGSSGSGFPAYRQAVAKLVLSSVLFGVMAVGAKVVSRRIPGAETALIRFAVGIVIAVVALVVLRVEVRPRRWGWLLARGVFGGAAVLAYFSCIEHIPVGTATLLNYTAPVYTMLFSSALLREPPPRGALAGFGVTMVGVALVVGGHASSPAVGFWELIGALSAVASGMAVTSIRAARRPLADGTPVETSWSVFLSFTAFGALVTLPAVAPPFGRWVQPTPAEWGLLAGVGLVSVAAQLLMTQALRDVAAATSGVIHQLTVVVALGVGVVFLGEPLGESALAGSALTMAGVMGTITASESLAARRPRI